MDRITRCYIGTMRSPTGQLFKVQWARVEEQGAKMFPFPTPYGSGYNNPTNVFKDLGWVGEIPPRRTGTPMRRPPSWVSNSCYCGIDDYWKNGWPDGTPPVVLRDGWPAACEVPVSGVISVGLKLPFEFQVTVSPITRAGDLTAVWKTAPASRFLGTPATGPDEIPSLRELVDTDIPGLPATILISDLVDTARLGAGTADATTFLRGDQTWVTIPGGSGTVTSVAASTVAPLQVLGSPIVGAGTLAFSFADFPEGAVFNRPAGSGTGPPGAHLLTSLDIPTIDVGSGTSGNLPATRLSGTVDIPTQTSGNLPTSRLSGTVDIPTQTSGNLPTSRLSGTVPAGQVGAIDVNTGTTGSLPGSRLSGTGTIAGSLIISIDGATQITGVIPGANLPAGIPIAGTVGQFLQWISTTFHHTDFNTSGTSNTKTLVTLPAFGTVHAIAYKCTVAFVGGTTFPMLSLGYSSGGGSTTSSTTRYGSALPISSTTNLASYQTGSMPETQNEVGSWNLTATVSTGSGNLNTLTAGTIIIDVLVSVRH